MMPSPASGQQPTGTDKEQTLDRPRASHVTPLFDLFVRLSPDAHPTRAEVEEAVEASPEGSGLTVGAAALFTLLRREGIDPDRGAADWWLDLADGMRAAVLLLEIEAVPLESAALLLGCSPELLRDAYERVSSRMELETSPLVVDCPGRATVARVYRVGGDEGMIALRHLEACVACHDWHAVRQERRRRIALVAPNIGVTGIGFVLDPPR